MLRLIYYLIVLLFSYGQLLSSRIMIYIVFNISNLFSFLHCPANMCIYTLDNLWTASLDFYPQRSQSSAILSIMLFKEVLNVKKHF